MDAEVAPPARPPAVPRLEAAAPPVAVEELVPSAASWFLELAVWEPA